MAGRSLLVVDTDPGTDDALAFALLARTDGLPRLAFVSSYGNMPLDVTHANLRRILSLVGLGGSLYLGSEAPIEGPLPDCGGFHGPDGLGGVAGDIEDAWNGPEGTLAELADEICAAPAVTYLSIGPLTNLARILRMRPEAAFHIDGLLAMGGGFDRSNMPHGAEYNFAADPVADAEVFGSGIPVTLFPLDLTHRYPLVPEQVEALPLAAYAQLHAVLDANRASNMAAGEPGAVVHDAFPVLYLREPAAFEAQVRRVYMSGWGSTELRDDGTDVEVVLSARDGLLFEALADLS